jgi:hypothetical protein
MMRRKYQYKGQENVFALVQIFNAIPSPPFSEPGELRNLIYSLDLYSC